MQNAPITIKEQLKIQQTNYSGQIQISVSTPQLNQTQTIPFYTYKIKGNDMHGQFIVRRRYRDFDHLRKKLTNRWLGIYIPPISGKRSQNNPLQSFKFFDKSNKQKQYAQLRSKFLNYFCQAIANKPYIYYCDLFQAFLRGGAYFQNAIQPLLSKDDTFLLNSYESNFVDLLKLTQNLPYQSQKLLNQNNLLFLSNTDSALHLIFNQIVKTSQQQHQYIIQLNQCLGKTLPQYENRFMLSQAQKQQHKSIVKRNQQFYLKLQQLNKLNMQNPLEGYLQLLIFQIQQTKAFIQAIQGRKDAEQRKISLQQKIQSNLKQISKLQKGDFSIKSMFKSGTKESQINELILKNEIMKTSIKCLQKMIRIMITNTNFQIQSYKLKRGKQYVKISKIVGERQIQILDLQKVLFQAQLSAIC